MNPISNLTNDISRLVETYNSLQKYQYLNSYYDDETQKFVNSKDNPEEYQRAYQKAPYSYISSQWQYHMDSGFKPILKNTKALMKEIFNNLNEIDLNLTSNITQQLTHLKGEIKKVSKKNENNHTPIVQEFLDNKSYLSDGVTFPNYIQTKFLVKTKTEVKNALAALEQRELALEARSKTTKQPTQKLEEDTPVLEEKEPPFDPYSHQIPFFAPLPREKLKARDIQAAQQERLNYFRKAHHKNGNMLLSEFNQVVEKYNEAQRNNLLQQQKIENSLANPTQAHLDFTLTLEEIAPTAFVPTASGFIPPPPPPPGAYVTKTYAQKRAEEAEKQSFKEEDILLQSLQLDEKGILMLQLASNAAALQEAKSELICYLFGGEYKNKEISDPINKFNNLTEEQFNFLKDQFIIEAIKLEKMSKADWEANIYNPGSKITKIQISKAKHQMTENEKVCVDKIQKQLDSIDKLTKTFKQIQMKLKKEVETKNLLIQKANKGEMLSTEELIHLEKLQSPESLRHKTQLSSEKKDILRKLDLELEAFKKVIHSNWKSYSMIIKDGRNLIIEIKQGKKADFVREFMGNKTEGI
jgi:hypothetical protein